MATVKEGLLELRKLFKTYTWVKGVYASKRPYKVDGQKLAPQDACSVDEGMGFCMIGGIAKVEHLFSGESAYGTDLARAIADVVGEKYSIESPYGIPNWNDRETTTRDDILNVIEEAIEREERNAQAR